VAVFLLLGSVFVIVALLPVYDVSDAESGRPGRARG
jgi:hypothetical protein